MDSYQPIYDAVRSKISHGNIESAVVAAFSNSNLSYAIQMAEEAVKQAAYEYQRPSVVYRPSLYPDGSMWCALYGDNIMEGVCGFGETPSKAMYAFDEAWLKGRTPAAMSAMGAKIAEEEAREEAANNGQFGVST